MNCQIMTLEESVAYSCSFEEWSKQEKCMTNCGCRAIAFVGKIPICIEHLPDALIRCGSGAYLDKKTGTKKNAPHKYDFKEDFLQAARVEDTKYAMTIQNAKAKKQ
jgi:hypothetical protein